MQNHARPSSGLRPSRSDIQTLARCAVEELAERSKKPHVSSALSRLADLCDALTASNEIQYHNALSSLIASGLTSDEIFDSLVPDAARLLGDRWVKDDLSFVDVTIGSSRLQQTVRSFGPRCEMDNPCAPVGHSAFLVVPDFEQHTLGAFIAANQLRRRGFWVQLGIDLTVAQVCETLADQHFAMVGLSLGSTRSMGKVDPMIRKMRGSMAVETPVIIGGCGLSEGIADGLGRTADLISSDLDETIAFCDLEPSKGVQAMRKTFA